MMKKTNKSLDADRNLFCCVNNKAISASEYLINTGHHICMNQMNISLSVTLNMEIIALS